MVKSQHARSVVNCQPQATAPTSDLRQREAYQLAGQWCRVPSVQTSK